MPNNKFELTLDTLAPTARITIAADYTSGLTKYINGGNHNFVISGGSTGMYMRVWEGTEPSTWVNYSTSYALTSAMKSSGSHTVYLKIVDTVGNVSSAASVTYTVDNTPPTNLQYVHTGVADAVGNYHIKLTATDNQSGVESFHIISSIFTDDVCVLTPTSANTYDGNITIPADTSDGSYTLIIKAYDKVGNASDNYSGGTIIVDTTETTISVALYKAGTTTALGSKTNISTRTFKFIASFHAGPILAPDIVAFKYAVDNSNLSSIAWTEFSNQPIKYTQDNVTFGDSQGTHTLYYQGRDLSGNIVDGSVSFVYDTVAPGLTINLNKPNGKYKQGDTVTATYTTSGNDIASFKATYYDTAFHTKQTNELPIGSNKTYTFDDIYLSAPEYASYTITFTIIDDIGNTNTVTKTIYIDNTPPSVTLGEVSSYYNDTTLPDISINFNVTDTGSNIDKYQAWVSTSNSTSEAVPSGASMNDIVGAITYDYISGLNKISDGRGYYIHVRAYDQAGNYTNKVTGPFAYDSVAPTVNARFENTVIQSDGTNNVTTQLVVQFKDETTGIKEFKFTGIGIVKVNGSNSTDWISFSNNNYSSSLQTLIMDVIVTAAAGTKTLGLTFRDYAGNTSSVTNITVYVDAGYPTCSVTLYNSSSSGTIQDSTKDSPSKEPKFFVRITTSSTGDLDNQLWYNIHGSFIRGSTQGGTTSAGEVIHYEVGNGYAVGKYILFDNKLYKVTTAITTSDTPYTISNKITEVTSSDAKWRPFAYDSGKSYKQDGVFICSANSSEYTPETKTFNVVLVDGAGNTRSASASFIYDLKDPTADISTKDGKFYNIVSSNTEYRRLTYNSLSTTCKNNETYFDFTPNEDIVAYKVCAFESLTAAKAANPATATAIPTTGGSLKTSWSGTASHTKVEDIKIVTADLITATSSTNGAKIVVVFVKDKSGTWNTVQTQGLS